MPESVRVQPGIVHERLNAHLRPRGRIFGPDPANTAVTTIGSMIAIDASGSRWLKYGSVRRHVQSLQVVMADGQVMEFGREPIVAGASIDSNPRKRELINRLSAILAASTDVIRSQQPKSPLNRCGYNLADVVGENSIDLAGVMVGSEGTLGLITEATLATQSLPRHRGVVLLLYESLDKAARSVPLILPWRPAACDLMDRRHLSLVRESEVRFDLLIPAEAEAALLVEFEGDEPQEMRDQMRGLIEGVQQQARLAFGSRQAFDQEETELFLNLPNRAMPLLVSAQGPQPPGARGRGRVGPAGRASRLPGADAERAQAPAGHGIAALPRRPRAVAHPAVSRSGRSQRRAADAADGRGTLRRGVQRRRHDRRRTRLRAQPHASSSQRQAGPLYEVLRQVKQIFDPGKRAQSRARSSATIRS